MFYFGYMAKQKKKNKTPLVRKKQKEGRSSNKKLKKSEKQKKRINSIIQVSASKTLLKTQKKELPVSEEEIKPVTTSETTNRATMGRCVGRTFNYDEAKGICQQFEAAGYESVIMEKKRGGLVLYEVWATKRDETLY